MPYVVLLISALLLGVAVNLPLGSFPLALSGDGASHGAIALAIGCGAFAALVASLPIGALSDQVGRLGMMRASAGASLLVLAALGIAHGALPGAVLLGLRSVAFVAYATAQFAYASSLVGPQRSVSAVGSLGIIGNLSFALGPALGVWLWQHGIGREQYLWASVVAIPGVAILYALPSRHDPHRPHPSRTIMMRSVWLPAIVYLVASALQSGVNIALAVLTFQQRGIANGALIFTASAVMTVTLRYPAGLLVERFGAGPIAIPAALIQAVGCVLAIHASSAVSVIVAGMLLGTAWSAIVPVALELLFERSTPGTRGAAMGAYNLALSLGAALGALLAAGATLAGPGYALAIGLCGAAPLGALPWLLRQQAAQRPNGVRA